MTDRMEDKTFGHLGCVIMASGEGRRFGGNKLMADFCGEPIIARVLHTTEGLFSHRVVVTRHADIADLCASRGVETVVHSLPLRSDTVALGIRTMPEDVTGCLFCPADQPLLSRTTIQALCRAFLSAPDMICRCAWEGQPGAPVLFPRWAFPELACLPAGKGGGVLAARYPERVLQVPVASAWELMDVDTQEDLARLSAFIHALE